MVKGVAWLAFSGLLTDLSLSSEFHTVVVLISLRSVSKDCEDSYDQSDVEIHTAPRQGVDIGDTRDWMTDLMSGLALYAASVSRS